MRCVCVCVRALHAPIGAAIALLLFPRMTFRSEPTAVRLRYFICLPLARVYLAGIETITVRLGAASAFLLVAYRVRKFIVQIQVITSDVDDIVVASSIRTAQTIDGKCVNCLSHFFRTHPE